MSNKAKQSRNKLRHIAKFLESLTGLLVSKISRFLGQILFLQTEFSEKKGSSNSRVTGADLIHFLKRLEKELPAMHDLKLQFKTSLQQHLLVRSYKIDKTNKGIKLEMSTSNPSLTTKIQVYPNLVQVDVGCSCEPFECNHAGMERLISLLEEVRHFLLDQTGKMVEIPETRKWELVHYHLNIDGVSITYSGPRFNITLETANGKFTRFYSKFIPQKARLTPRLEEIRTPRIPLEEEIQKILQECEAK